MKSLLILLSLIAFMGLSSCIGGESKDVSEVNQEKDINNDVEKEKKVKVRITEEERKKLEKDFVENVLPGLIQGSKTNNENTQDNENTQETESILDQESILDKSDIKKEEVFKEFEMDSFTQIRDGQYFPQFSVKNIEVNKGDLVRLKINTTKGVHDITIDEFDVFSETPEGEVTIVEFVADKAGSFEYYCSKPNHRKNGHFGTIIVK